jgi:hypothetical protein
VAPQIPLAHWSLPLHAAPSLSPEHVPTAPGLLQPTVPWQSLSAEHDVLHAVALAQMTPPAHAVAALVMHVPMPSHTEPLI